MIKKLLAILGLSFFASVANAQSTYPAAGCSQAQIQAAVTTEQATPVDGDIISIPAGNCTWTGSQQISVTFHNSVTIQGAGAISATTGGASTTGTDQTIILNNTTSGTLFNITTTAGKSFRFTGMALTENGSSSTNATGHLFLNGNSSAVRVDHNHFVLTVEGTATDLYIGGSVTGVADHNFYDTANVALTFDLAFHNGAGWNGTSTSNSFGSWADADHWGSSEFFFVEDSQFSNGGITDAHDGDRYVFRHNTVTGSSGTSSSQQMYSHGITSDPVAAPRAVEVYDNNFVQNGNQGNPVTTLNSGTMLFWGNTITGGWRNGLGISYQFRTTAGGGGNYNYPPTPNGWGFCGPGTPQNGVINVSSGGIATWVSGGTFSTGWPVDSPIFVNGSENFAIASVASSTSLTLLSVSGGTIVPYNAGTLTGVSYTTASAWDSNNQIDGNACLMQPGRGKGDLLTGSSFPSIVNTTTSTVAWAHEALSPIYIFNNIYTPQFFTSSPLVGNGSITTSDNVDYYQQYGSLAEPGSNCTTSPCNITVGVNQAARAPVNGTDTCAQGTDPVTGGAAPGVGWWDTANNSLFVCSPNNTWTIYYQPYTYPHPLTQSAQPIPPAPVGAFFALGH